MHAQLLVTKAAWRAGLGNETCLLMHVLSGVWWRHAENHHHAAGGRRDGGGASHGAAVAPCLCSAIIVSVMLTRVPDHPRTCPTPTPPFAHPPAQSAVRLRGSPVEPGAILDVAGAVPASAVQGLLQAARSGQFSSIQQVGVGDGG